MKNIGLILRTKTNKTRSSWEKQQSQTALARPGSVPSHQVPPVLCRPAPTPDPGSTPRLLLCPRGLRRGQCGDTSGTQAPSLCPGPWWGEWWPPGKVTLFGQRVFADVVKLRVWIMQVGPQCHRRCPCESETGGDIQADARGRSPVKTGVTWPPATNRREGPLAESGSRADSGPGPRCRGQAPGPPCCW